MTARLVVSRSEDDRSILVAWLKLNAAERYLDFRKFYFASTFARHFLFGKGEGLDIGPAFVKYLTHHYPVVLKKNDRGDPALFSGSEDDVLARYINDSLRSGLSTDKYAAWEGREVVLPALETRLLLLRGEKPKAGLEFDIHSVVYSHIDLRDLYYAMNRYTLRLKGEIDGPLGFFKGEKGYDFVSLPLVAVGCRISDQYSWKVVSASERVLVGGVLHPLAES